jgi:hypothetical protein
VRSLAAQARYRAWARFNFDAKNAQYSDPEVTSHVDLVQRIAARSLFWLGLTAVAARGDSDWVSLTENGRALLGLEPHSAQAIRSADRFVLQANLEVFAPPDLAAPLLFRLFAMSEPSGRGMLSLSRESLRQAMDSGESSASILDFLRSNSQTGVPQNVEYLIRDVAGHHGQIEVGHAGLYLKVADPTLLKELTAQKNLKIGFRRMLTEDVALITGESVDAVLKALRQGGYLPVSADGRSTEKSPAKSTAAHFEDEPVSRHDNGSTISEVDARIDWDSVAKSEGLPYRDKHPAHQPSRANGTAYIQDLIIRAIEEQRCLEIVYRPANHDALTERVIEPHEVIGPLLYAYCRLREDWRNFNIRSVLSARMTDETFEPRE